MPLGLQKDGTYILEANEQSLDCDRLYKAIWGRVQNMKTMPAKAKAELDQAPPTAFLALGRIFGGQSKGWRRSPSTIASPPTSAPCIAR